MKVFKVLIICYLLFIGIGTQAICQPANQATVQSHNTTAPPSVVTPNQAKQTTDIYDILPPQPMAVDYFLSAMWIIGALVVVILIIATLAYLYRRRKKITHAVPVIHVPPDEKALAALDHLSKSPDFSPRKFYFALSLIVRQYIQDRFKTNTVEMTLEEILPTVARLYLTEAQKRYLKNFFISSDEIKFAKMMTDRETAENDLQLAIEFVKQTRSRNDASHPDSARISHEKN